ncbi:DNA/RNA non-specific endonuclease [Brachyspira pulli]|uniref:DNA/RNA non-specific endonuclease n=1 Tax=Brachyspira pulli TaxID=310721 RepID=UPI0030075453
MINNYLKTIFIVFILFFYAEVNFLYAENSSNTIFEETVFEETTFEKTAFGEIAFETINYVRNNLHSADINELDLSIVQDENSFSDNIESLSYSDVLKEVNWKSVIPKVAAGGAIIAVVGVLSLPTVTGGSIVLPFVFGMVAKEAIIEGAIGSAVVSVLNSCIQAAKNGQTIDKRVIKYAIEGAADGFMWGAISGAIVGGIKSSIKIKSPAITSIKTGNAVKKVLAKNATRINKQGHLSKTDDLGRLTHVEAKELKLVEDGIRKPHNQQGVVRGAIERNPAKYADRNYDGGHIIARIFGGSPDIDNIVPMPKSVNRAGGKWRKMEEEIAQLLKSGNRVTDFKVKINYRGADQMPYSFHVRYKVNGEIRKMIIDNRYR